MKAEWDQIHVTNQVKDKELDFNHPPPTPSSLLEIYADINKYSVAVSALHLQEPPDNHWWSGASWPSVAQKLIRNSEECRQSGWMSVMEGDDETEAADRRRHHPQTVCLCSHWNSLHVRREMLFSLHLNHSLHAHWTWKVHTGVCGECCMQERPWLKLLPCSVHTSQFIALEC